MVYWETAHTVPNQPQVALDWARQWQAAEKIRVISRTLTEPRSARTRIVREFDPDVMRRLKADVRHDITVDGPQSPRLPSALVLSTSFRARLPCGGRRRETVFSGSCAAETGIGG